MAGKKTAPQAQGNKPAAPPGPTFGNGPPVELPPVVTLDSSVLIAGLLPNSPDKFAPECRALLDWLRDHERSVSTLICPIAIAESVAKGIDPEVFKASFLSPGTFGFEHAVNATKVPRPSTEIVADSGQTREAIKVDALIILWAIGECGKDPAGWLIVSNDKGFCEQAEVSTSLKGPPPRAIHVKQVRFPPEPAPPQAVQPSLFEAPAPTA